MSSIELVCLEISVLLFLAHVACQGALASGEFDTKFLASPRDEAPEPRGVAYGRATRALANFVENYGAFLAMDLGLIATGHTGGWGAAVWIVARIVYLPLYLLGIPCRAHPGLGRLDRRDR